MRGVVGLALVLISISMAWLIIIGKFPPQTSGKGLLGEFGAQLANARTADAKANKTTPAAGK